MPPKNCWSFSKTVNSLESYFEKDKMPAPLLELK
jgi:hypothetical protein